MQKPAEKVAGPNLQKLSKSCKNICKQFNTKKLKIFEQQFKLPDNIENLVKELEKLLYNRIISKEKLIELINLYSQTSSYYEAIGNKLKFMIYLDKLKEISINKEALKVLNDESMFLLKIDKLKEKDNDKESKEGKTNKESKERHLLKSKKDLMRELLNKS